MPLVVPGFAYIVVLCPLIASWFLKVLGIVGAYGQLNGTFRGSRKQTKEVIMVDPLEAKRLAAEEWKLLQARAALQVFLTTSVWLLLTCIFALEDLQFH